MPKRILDLSRNKIQLLESQNLRERYACLSYRRGEEAFPATTSSTVDRNRICVPPDALPSTLLDPISVSRKLEIRYLWIDSLCILQDDKNDWEEQAADMASIYQNAYLVLSATKSAGAHEGLFADVDLTFTPRTVPVAMPDGGSEIIYVRHPLTYLNSDLPGDSPLPALLRGWIFKSACYPAVLCILGHRS